MKKVAILGSTGSIGCQALEVVDELQGMFSVEILTANSNVSLLLEQARKYNPNIIVIGDKSLYPELSKELSGTDIKVFAGHESIAQVVEITEVDVVLVALVGFSGLQPTLSALNSEKAVALANKETLVVGGSLVTEAAWKNKAPIIPVDSEHSAIFQCLAGELSNPVEKLILTASGGPFRDYSQNRLETITCDEALAHPTWNMGRKVTIDSATLMNKGLEVIEARWLFNVPADKIEVVVHPQSVIHSMVQFQDGSIKAQLGIPDMRIPIQYALTYPSRVRNSFPRFDFAEYPQLTFQKPDTVKFRNLALAYHAISMGGNMPCILNAANEIAVEAFLERKTGFLQIPEIIEKTMNSISHIPDPGLNDLIDTDSETRSYAFSLI